MRPLLPLLLAVCVLAGAALSPALAQLPLGRSKPNPDNPILTADFAFEGNVCPNRWTPILITLTGGAKPFEGVLSISYAQDDRIGTQIVRAVTATPGKTSSFSALVNLPTNCSQILVTLQRPGERPFTRVEFNQFPDPSKGEAWLPAVSGAVPLVAVLGERTDPTLAPVRAIADVDAQSQQDRSATGVARPSISFLAPALLPPSWTSLDGALLAVTTGDNARACDARTVAAVREWVSAGGRLVILADPVGDAWRDWFSPSPDQPLPIGVAPAQNGPVPDTLAEALAWRPPVGDPPPSNGYTGAAVPPPTSTPVRSRERAEPIEAAPSITARYLSLTELGREAGWSLRYSVSDDPERGLLAEGPFGFGWITVVGFNPERAAGSVTSEATRRVWYDVLATALADWRARSVSSAVAVTGWVNNSFSGGGFAVADMDAQIARNMVLDQISNVPTVSHAVFPLLAAGILILALFLGPVDAFLLKALRARHRSWATALLWISLASLVAYYIPTLVRSGDTIVNRFTILDASQVGAPPNGPVPAWRTGVTGVFAGESFRQEFQGALGGSWWRPTSGRQEYYWGPRSSMSPKRAVTARQSLPDFSALAPPPPDGDQWNGFRTGEPSAGGNLLAPSAAKVWTFHTFQDQARTTTTFRASVACDHSTSPPTYTVSLDGVPNGATISAALLRVSTNDSDRWHSLLDEPSDGIAATVKGEGTATPPAPWAPPDTTTTPSSYYSSGWGSPQPANYALPFLLPGPDRRTHGVLRAVEHGHAVLYFVATGMPADITLNTTVRSSHTQLCRFIVPVTHTGAPAPDTAPAHAPPTDVADDEESPL